VGFWEVLLLLAGRYDDLKNIKIKKQKSPM
jgi:hypothetical protein